MAISYYLYLHEVRDSYPIASSETFFHIQMNYSILHPSRILPFRRIPVNFDTVNYVFPREQLLSPESGATTVREILSRWEASRTVVDPAVSDVLSFARNAATRARNAGRPHVSLQVNLIAISSDDNTNVQITRASTEALERVNYDTLSPSEREGTCPVCLDEFAEKKEKGFRRMPCSHVFHEGCIFEWLKTAHSCPLCRHALRPDR